MESTKEETLTKSSEDLLSIKGILSGKKPKNTKASFEDYIVTQTARSGLLTFGKKLQKMAKNPVV